MSDMQPKGCNKFVKKQIQKDLESAGPVYIPRAKLLVTEALPADCTTLILLELG